MYEEEIDLRVYIDVLLRRRRLILTLALGMAVVAAGVSFLLPPTYEAQAALSVAPRRSNITLTENFVLSEEGISQLAANQRAEALSEIAKSLRVAQSVMEAHPELFGEETTPSSMVNAIEVSSKNDILIITASADDSQKAAKMATAWAEATRNQINKVYTFDPETVTEIQTQIDKSWQEYKDAQTALETFLSDSEISALRSRSKIIDSLLRNYEQALADITSARYTESLSSQRQELQKLYNQKIIIQQQLIDARALYSQISATGDVVTAMWGSALAFINLQANAYGGSPGSLLQFDLTGAPPPLTADAVAQIVMGLENKLSAVQTQIDELSAQLGEVDTVASPLESKNALQQQITALVEELATLEAQLEEKKAKKLELTEARDVAWTTYTSLANKARELNVQQSVSASESRLAFKAVPPGSPSAPNKKMNTAVAGTLGLMLGVFGAFMIEYLVPEPASDVKRDVLSRWLLAEAPGLPNFDPEQQTAKAPRNDIESSRETDNSAP